MDVRPQDGALDAGGEAEGDPLARLFNEKHGIGADLIVIRVANWRRSQWQDQTGLPWVNPSPNLRSLAALMSSPGSVYFEGTTISEGRGTDRPFEQVGAPWLDAAAVTRTMERHALPASASRRSRCPSSRGGEARPADDPGDPLRHHRPAGVSPRAHVAGADRRDPPPASEGVRVEGTINRLTGSDKVRRAIEEGWMPRLLDEWDREAAAFKRERAPYLMYE